MNERTDIMGQNRNLLGGGLKSIFKRFQLTQLVRINPTHWGGVRVIQHGCYSGWKGWKCWKGWKGQKSISFSRIISIWLEFDTFFCPHIHFMLLYWQKVSRVESFAISRIFSSIAKVNTREIVLPSSFAKYQSRNSKIWHENKKISPKFPSFAKIYTRET